MKEIDFDRALMLMEVMARVANVAPMSSNIAGEASLELTAINNDCKENALERAKERADEEARNVAARQQELSAQTDEELLADADVDVRQPDPKPVPTVERKL